MINRKIRKIIKILPSDLPDLSVNPSGLYMLQKAIGHEQ
jgi:hypothetical protein